MAGLPRYRSRLKLAILAEVVKNPHAHAREICRLIDRKGSAEAPAPWRANKGDRCLLSVYDAKGARQAKLKVEISKVRSDFKKSRIKAHSAETEVDKLRKEIQRARKLAMRNVQSVLF